MTCIHNEFSLANWQSSIRHFVRAYADVAEYRDISQWAGCETADITYQDRGGALLEHFRLSILGGNISGSQPWLPDWLWEQDEETNVEWLFEVKTTTGPCDTDFFMSPNQYKMMKSLSGDHAGLPRRQVYCLIRVYNLLTDCIGIRFFIDPWRYRDHGLEFGTTDKWKVTAT